MERQVAVSSVPEVGMECIETQKMTLASPEREKMYPIPDLVKGRHHLRNTRFYIPYYGLFTRFLNQR
jgi:hypothetical protein